MGNQQATLKVNPSPLGRAELRKRFFGRFRTMRIRESPQRPYAAHPPHSLWKGEEMVQTTTLFGWPVKVGVVG